MKIILKNERNLLIICHWDISCAPSYQTLTFTTHNYVHTFEIIFFYLNATACYDLYRTVPSSSPNVAVYNAQCSNKSETSIKTFKPCFDSS